MSKVIAFIGKSGTGKTTNALKQLFFENQYDLIILYSETTKFFNQNIFKYKNSFVIQIENFNKLFTIIEKNKGKKIGILIDDADIVLSKVKSEDLTRLFAFKRNYNLDIYITIKRLFYLNSYFKFSIDRMYIFQYPPHFLNDFKKLNFSDELINKISNLQRHQYIIIDF